jgi:DNA repair photolyase
VKERLRALERIHSRDIKTFAFVGPLLPGNPESLIEHLEGKVDRILIDKMNYIHSIKRFYDQLALQKGTTNGFFSEYKERLMVELINRKMKFEVLF